MPPNFLLTVAIENQDGGLFQVNLIRVKTLFPFEDNVKQTQEEEGDNFFEHTQQEAFSLNHFDLSKCPKKNSFVVERLVKVGFSIT